ncbi:hypothetical protein Tco_0413278 [Tanacetum coccineum]
MPSPLQKLEYFALSGCCAQILLVAFSTSRLWIAFTKSRCIVTIKCFCLCCNSVQHSALKHIDIRHHLYQRAGTNVADSIAERLTRQPVYKFKKDCSIILLGECDSRIRCKDLLSYPYSLSEEIKKFTYKASA